MKIGVVGLGTVGSAVQKGLMSLGHEVYVNDIDPKKNMASKEYLMTECEVVFLCVDTPMLVNGACDLSNVYEAFNQLSQAWAFNKHGVKLTDRQPVIAVKSTVIPETCVTLSKLYPWVCCNPEFLREDSALSDFLHPDRIIIGYDKPAVTEAMKKLYEPMGYPIRYMSLTEAELVKYLSNAYLTLKVAFSQEALGICNLFDADASLVMKAICLDHRINESHMEPNKGKITSKSKCLPKDILGLIKHVEQLSTGYDPWLLKTAYIKGIQDSSFAFKLEVKP